MVAAGRASFRAYCAGCHGPDAKGDGPAAAQLTVRPADLTHITTRYGSFPDQAIYDRIDGYSNPADSTVQMMPAWGSIWRGVNREWETPQDVRQRINEIVAYLKTIQNTTS
jgi:mono/diheme cytochrome c family protein